MTSWDNANGAPGPLREQEFQYIKNQSFRLDLVLILLSGESRDKKFWREVKKTWTLLAGLSQQVQALAQPGRCPYFEG